MARDTYLPRLLTRLVLAMLAAAFAMACEQAPRDHQRTADVGRGDDASRAGEAPGTERADQSDVAAALARVAWARLRWPGGAVLDANLLERLDEPVHAGSIFKLVVARAALAQGLVTADTRIVCRRQVTVQGRRVDCVHPDLGRPLTLDDALAHSCNHFFVRLAERLDRAGLATTLRHLSAGTITMPDQAPLPLVALGLEGPRVGMRAWARVAVAAMAFDAADPEGSVLVRRGVLRAVSEGSATDLGDPTTQTLAKTGTTMPATGLQDGRVVAWRPEIAEVIVVRAAGVPGRDAAMLARALWDAAAARNESQVRVGRLRVAADEASASRASSDGQRPRRPDHPPLVETIALEAYVAGVVAAEGEPDMPAVALQALAIAARSYASAPDGRHARDGYDVCDTTHCQVLGAATRWSRDAAARTRGLVLTRGQAIVSVPYSASCSGVLASPRELWGGGPVGITRTGPDPAQHTVATWRSDVTADALLGALREGGYRGDVLRDVRIAARLRDGLASRIALDGLAPADIDATTFRHLVGRRLGWDVLKSHAFDVARSGRGYRFTGRGKGHGAGLCLRGAAAFAARGVTVAQVLATYAPGTSLRAAQDRLTLRVPSALTSSVPRLRRDVFAVLADLRLRLAVAAPRDTLIDVHPTMAAYQRATGRAWWTSASTRATRPAGTAGPTQPPLMPGQRYRIDLPPSGPRRGAEEALLPTLRHELVHVLTGSVLAAGPAWAAEGLAHAAGRGVALPAAPPGTARPCPTDDQVSRPGSLEAMRQVYAGAAGCVLAALPDGLDTWRALALH